MLASMWMPGDDRLAPSEELSHALALIEAYLPEDRQQLEFKTRIQELAREHPDLLHRECLSAHLTASALVMNPDRNKFLLHHHAKLNRWLQFGGHCDGDANLQAVALRESIEESGVEDLSIDPTIVDIDIHEIPARGGVPTHLHLDVRFCVHAPEGCRTQISDESLSIEWYRVDEVEQVDTDESVLRLVRKLQG